MRAHSGCSGRTHVPFPGPLRCKLLVAEPGPPRQCLGRLSLDGFVVLFCVFILFIYITLFSFKQFLPAGRPWKALEYKQEFLLLGLKCKPFQCNNNNNNKVLCRFYTFWIELFDFPNVKGRDLPHWIT